MRKDTGNINSSPDVTMPPIVKAPSGCISQFRLNGTYRFQHKKNIFFYCAHVNNCLMNLNTAAGIFHHANPMHVLNGIRYAI